MSGRGESEAAKERADRLGRMAVVLNAGLAIALAATWVSMAVRGEFWRADFINYYTGWSIVRDGRGDRLYDRDLQARYQERIVPQRGTGSLLLFNYPPHLAIPASVFALLPRATAFFVWDFAHLLLLFPLIHFLRCLTPDLNRLRFAVLLTAVLAFPPLFMSFQLGQVSLFILVCLLGFTWNLLGGRPFGTAFWLVLGTIKPQLMVAPAMILLAGRRWRELGIAAALFAVWALATTAFLGVACWSEFLTMLRYSAGQFGADSVHPLAMYNLKGFLTAVLGERQAAFINGASMAALILVLLVTLWIWRKEWRIDTARFDLRLALTLQLSLLANPHSYPADALALVAPALLFHRGWRRLGRSTTALDGLLVCGPLLFALDCYGLPAGSLAGVHPFFLLALALTAAAVVALIRLEAREALPTPVPQNCN